MPKSINTKNLRSYKIITVKYHYLVYYDFCNP